VSLEAERCADSLLRRTVMDGFRCHFILFASVFMSHD